MQRVEPDELQQAFIEKGEGPQNLSGPESIEAVPSQAVIAILQAARSGEDYFRLMEEGIPGVSPELLEQIGVHGWALIAQLRDTNLARQAERGETGRTEQELMGQVGRLERTVEVKDTALAEGQASAIRTEQELRERVAELKAEAAGKGQAIEQKDIELAQRATEAETAQKSMGELIAGVAQLEALSTQLQTSLAEAKQERDLLLAGEAQVSHKREIDPNDPRVALMGKIQHSIDSLSEIYHLAPNELNVIDLVDHWIADHKKDLESAKNELDFDYQASRQTRYLTLTYPVPGKFAAEERAEYLNGKNANYKEEEVWRDIRTGRSARDYFGFPIENSAQYRRDRDLVSAATQDSEQPFNERTFRERYVARRLTPGVMAALYFTLTPEMAEASASATPQFNEASHSLNEVFDQALIHLSQHEAKMITSYNLGEFCRDRSMMALLIRDEQERAAGVKESLPRNLQLKLDTVAQTIAGIMRDPSLSEQFLGNLQTLLAESVNNKDPNLIRLGYAVNQHADDIMREPDSFAVTRHIH